ncbi:ABC transporter substrate-binding protein [Mycolicibacterium nivoides]|uniref:ABC transporter substrate-binding protein n=1 Tax=Mycolicibacterium nivoides TaxID=2487344 RepID=A0ABW9LNN9_9MYCO
MAQHGKSRGSVIGATLLAAVRFLHRDMMVLLGVIVLAAAGATGCGSTTGSAEDALFRLGMTAIPDSLNPFVAQQSVSNAILSFIYPLLVAIDAQGDPAPDFAQKWSVSPDGRTWTFSTQPDAKWSDGQPLTAEDAAWTLNTIVKFKDGPTANQAGYVTGMASASAPNPTTVVVQYEKPIANVLSQLSVVPLLPKHVWEQYAEGDGRALTAFENAAPIVSGGRFRLAKHVAKQQVLLERNSDFYGRRPQIHALGIQIFGSDDAMIAALNTGQLDGVMAVAPTLVASLQDKYIVRSSPYPSFDDLIINSNPNQNPKQRELLDPLLREAFDHAIDRPGIIKTALLGYAQEGASIVPPAEKMWNDPSITPTPFDLAKANELLDRAGYQLGPNNVRIANGHPMSYTVVVPTGQGSYISRMFLAIQSDFAKIGVQLQQQNLDASAAMTAIMANDYRQFQLALWGWSLQGTDPDDVLSYLTCAQLNSANDNGYCTNEWDALYEAQSSEMNPTKRKLLVDRMQKIAAAERGHLVIAYPDQIEAHTKEWTDLPIILGTSFNPVSFETLRRSNGS